MYSGYNLNRCLEEVLKKEIQELELKFFFDDILVFGKSWEELIRRIGRLFRVMNEKGFTLKVDSIENNFF